MKLLLLIILSTYYYTNSQEYDIKNVREFRLGAEYYFEYTEDKELKSCLENSDNFNTLGMNACIGNSIRKWYNKLDSTFTKIMISLPDDMKPSFEKQQSDWALYKDTEMEFSNKLYRLRGGTFSTSAILINDLKLLRKRCIDLDILYQSLFQN